MRDGLIELLNKSFKEQYEKRGLLTAVHTVDYLIANGAILLPCKVGDKVYAWYFDEILSYVVTNYEIDSIATDGINTMLFGPECIGKTVFLTKEDAEKALKEKDNG